MKRSNWANGLRGIAVLLVLFFHYYVTFWVRQDVAADLARRPPMWMGDTRAPALAKWVAHIPVDFGALGVALFFLLSGFVIAISLDQYSRRGFVVGRLLRVLPTYAAGYACSCAVVAMMSDPKHELNLLSIMVGMVPGLTHLLGRPVPGDGIVWTLIIEILFYMLCVLLYRRLTTGWFSVAAVAISCALFQVVFKPADTGTFFGGVRFVLLLACPFLPVMLMGTVLSSMRRRQISRYQAVSLQVFLALVYFALASTTVTVPTSMTYRLTFLGAMLVFASVFAVGDHWNGNGVVNFFAKISYPLYVVHPVLGYATLWTLVNAGWGIAAALLTATVMAIVVATIVHYLVEVPSHRLGQRWARAISALPQQPAESAAVQQR